MTKIVAWTYMVEAETGLSKKQLNSLLFSIPQEAEVVPFSNDEESMLEANSIAYGFIDNGFIEEYETEIKQTLANVCNDWDKVRKDKTYTTPSGLKVVMLCDA